jgi:hypothetical protein
MVTFAVIDGMYGHDGITLPVGGKDYLVRPPGARLGIEIWGQAARKIMHAEGHRDDRRRGAMADGPVGIPDGPGLGRPRCLERRSLLGGTLHVGRHRDVPIPTTCGAD